MDKGVLEDQVQSALGRLFKKVEKQREEHYSQLITILKEGQDALNSKGLSKGLNSFQSDLDSSFRVLGDLSQYYADLVTEVTDELEEQVTLAQSETRFAVDAEDNSTVKILKSIKRVVRSTGKRRTAFSNRFRNMAGKSEASYSPWMQDVPLKELVRFHLANKRFTIANWLDEDTQGWISAANILSTDESEDKTASSFDKDNVLDLLESEITAAEKAKSLLKEQMKKDCKEFENEILGWAEKAGTVERRNSFYTQLKAEKAIGKCQEKIDNRFEGWQSAFKKLLDRADTIREFLQFEHMLKEKGKALNKEIDSYFSTIFYNKLHEAEKKLNDRLEMVSDKASNKEGFISFLQNAKEETNKLLAHALEELKKVLEEESVSKEVLRFSELVFLKANDLKEKAQFLHDIKEDAKPLQVSSREIEWRLLVVRVLKEQLLASIDSSKQNYEAFLEQQRAEMQEVVEVIEVNFESAIDLCKGGGERGEDPAEIVREGIERTLSKIEAIKEVTQQKQEEIKLAVIDNTDTLSHKLLHLIDNGDSNEFQIIDAKYRVKETAQGWRTKLGARWARLQDRILLFSRFIWKKTKLYTDKVRRFLGFKDEEVQEVKKADIATYLTETDAKIKELPYIYRKLFNFDVDADRRFYVSLNENYNYLKKSFESWENGFPSTFSVVGEKGSGKSTYISLIMEEFFSDKQVTQLILAKTYWTQEHLFELFENKLGIEQIESKEGIIEEIRTNHQGSVMVIESLQNLYLRNINGYQAMEDLMYIISETKDKVFWMVSCSRYGWNFLNEALSLGDYFSHILKTDMLDESQIENVIMSRHRSSGYELTFEADESHAKSRAYRKLLDREDEAQQYLKEKYFEDLSDLALGNASIAMIFWIRSIREFDETHCYIKPLEVTTLEMVQELKPNVLFTLAALVLHDALSAKELCGVLQFDEQQSRVILSQLKTRGLLQEKDGQYIINQLMYRQVVRVLKERNIIHLV